MFVEFLNIFTMNLNIMSKKPKVRISHGEAKMLTRRWGSESIHSQWAAKMHPSQGTARVLIRRKATKRFIHRGEPKLLNRRGKARMRIYQVEARELTGRLGNERE